jgi:hypothetical protein
MFVTNNGKQSQFNGLLQDSSSQGANIGITYTITGTDRNSGGLSSLEEFNPDTKLL